MNSHEHARLTRAGRALLVDRVLQQNWTMKQADEAAGVSPRTGYKWLAVMFQQVVHPSPFWEAVVTKLQRHKTRQRMNSHKHARLTARGRVLLVERVLELGWKGRDASQAAGISERTAYNWLSRFKAEGLGGLCDRSSRPAHCPHATSPPK